MEEYSEDIYFTIIGASDSGKTSLANALLGFNECRDDDYISALDLFDVEEFNDFGYKNGHLLGEKNLPAITVVDTKSKSNETESKIDSA